MSNFKIGEKVVCIDDSKQSNSTILINSDCVKKWNIYTIRGFSKCDGILLDGLFGGVHKSGNEVGFKKCRFRKLDHQFGEDVCAEILKKVKEESLISSN